MIGRSVEGRAIRAWHLGEPGRTDAPRVLLISTMHGNEGATRRILAALRDGPRIEDLDLWVVPVCNPDGLRHSTRRNAHGVDLNRSYAYAWTTSTGTTSPAPYRSPSPRPGR